MTMNRFAWTNATSVDEAIGQLDGKSMIKAGGVDVLDRLKEGLDAPERLVNIRNVKGLDRIAASESGLTLGPLVTLAHIADDKTIREKFTALADAAGHAATPQIRNMATIGGNLLQRPRCWYFRQADFHCRKKGGEQCFAHDGENQYHAIFDNEICAAVHPSALAVALIALNARIELTGKKGKREVAVEEFFVAPHKDVSRENSIGADELITEIRVPSQGFARSAYIKQGEKESFDWPLAEVAVSLGVKGGMSAIPPRIVLGAAAPTPRRATAAEAELAGKKLTDEVVAAAAKAAVAGATPLAENGYKLAIFEAVVRRAIHAAIHGGSA